jgi:hypothetical protein
MKTRYCTIAVAGKYAGKELEGECMCSIGLSAMRVDSACFVSSGHVFKVLGCLVKEKLKLKFMFAYMITLIYLKDCSEIRSRIWHSFFVIGRFS